MTRSVYSTLMFVSVLLGCQCQPEAPMVETPLVTPPTQLPPRANLSTPAGAGADPNLLCGKCHEDIVQAYREHDKFHTSRPLVEHFPNEHVTLPQQTENTSAWLNDAHQLIQSQDYGDGGQGRDATAQIRLGSENASFAAMIRGKFRILPLTLDLSSERWQATTGYRGKPISYFDTDVETNCSECHGFSDNGPSFFGVPCNGCHGNMTAHLKDPKAPLKSEMNAMLKSAQGQTRICGHCHTHSKARLHAHSASYDQAPKDHETYQNDLRVYRRNEILDERIAGHGDRLSRSKCFEKSNNADMPMCSACHDPHGVSSVVKRTRETCQGCHQGQACLDQAGRTATSDCAQCHFSRVTERKAMHRNFMDHRITRAALGPDYWRSIRKYTLTPTFTAVHTKAVDPAEQKAELNLIRLNFLRPSKAIKVIDQMRTQRSTWPNSLNTLALLVHEIKSFNFPEAMQLRSEFEILTELPRKVQRIWAQAEQRVGRHREALERLEALRGNDLSVELLRLSSLVKLKETKAAIDLCLKLKDHYLEHPKFLNLLAATERLRSQHKTAQTWLEKSLRIDPHQVSIYVQLAQLLHERGESQRALTLLTRGLRFKTTSPRILATKGQIHHDLKQIPKAVQHWQESLRYDRKQFDVYAKLFQVALDTGDRNSARVLIRNGQSWLPNDPRWSTLESILRSKRKRQK